MVSIKTPEEIEIMKQGGKILAQILKKICRAANPGISTFDLEELALDLISKNKAKPSFKGYKGYPACLCISRNNQVVHGIPSKKEILKQGDIIDLDLGIKYRGLYTDMSITVSVGKVSYQARKLIKVTKKALDIGISQIKPGNQIKHIGQAIQKYVEKNGFSVVRSLVGHGVGYAVHEPPQIPNFLPKPGEKRWDDIKLELKPGMCLAIEPMVNVGGSEVRTLDDGWTVVTADGSLSAHFEHTIAVTENGHQILTK